MRVKRKEPLPGDYLGSSMGSKASPTLSTSTASAYYTHSPTDTMTTAVSEAGETTSQQQLKSAPQTSTPVSRTTTLGSNQNVSSHSTVTEAQPTQTRTLRPDSTQPTSSRMHTLQMDIKEYLNKSAGMVDKIRNGNPNLHPFRALSEVPSQPDSSSLAAKRGFWRRQNSAFVTSAMPAPERKIIHPMDNPDLHTIENDPPRNFGKQIPVSNGTSVFPLKGAGNNNGSSSGAPQLTKNLMGPPTSAREMTQDGSNENVDGNDEANGKKKRPASVRLRLKRFSIESVEQTTRTLNRLSLSSVKLRRTGTNKAVISGEPHSNDLALIASARTAAYGHTAQPYWKYHVIGFGNGLILATNPTATQDGCRMGPGYHVEIEYNDRANLATGFKLAFRRLVHVSDDAQPPVLTIIRKPDLEGGYFTLSVQRSSVLNPKTSLIDYHEDDYLYHDFDIGENYRTHEQYMSKSVYNGLVFPKGIPNKYLVSNSQNLVDGDSARKEEAMAKSFKNYEFKDFNNIKWSVGAIPRVKLSKRPRIRDKLFVPQYKYVNPNYSYFHQNYIEDDDLQQSTDDDNESIMTMTSKTTLSSAMNSNIQFKYKEQRNPQNVYFQGSNGDADFPPVLAVFRPKEKSYRRKQILKSINRKFQSPMYAHERGSRASMDGASIYDDDAGNDDFDTQSLRSMRSSVYGADGLYGDNTKDDGPENTKYGWLTVYEDREIFCKNKGMFDVVVGLTFAAGFDKLAAIYKV